MKRVLTAVAAFVITGAALPRVAAAQPGPPAPFGNVKALVQWGIPGATQSVVVSRIGGLVQKTDVITATQGGSPTGFVMTSPGASSVEAITLERGLSADISFAHWASETTAASDFRRDIQITVLDQQSNPVVIFDLGHCWVSAYRAFSPLEASGAAAATEQLTLQCDYWTRKSPTP